MKTIFSFSITKLAGAFLILLVSVNTSRTQCRVKASANLVLNSGFETGIAGWTLRTGMNGCLIPPLTSMSWENSSLKISVNNNYAPPCPLPFNWRSYVLGNMTGSLIQGRPYVFTFRARTNSSTPVHFDASVRLTSSEWQIAFQNQEIKAINQWQSFCKIDLHLQPTASNIEVAFFFGQVADGTEIWIDDVFVGFPEGFAENHKIRVNQIGYLLNYPKEGLSVDSCHSFTLKNAATHAVVYSGTCQQLGKYPHTHPAQCSYELDTVWRLSFTPLLTPGQYYLETDRGMTSFPFSVQHDVYAGLRKDAFRFFYFQRCGQALSAAHWASLARPACHSQDGNATVVNTAFVPVGTKNVSGGWHDAGDYVKYTFNNALSTVLLAKAYLENPAVFSDNEQIPESGNGVPDIVDDLAFNAAFLLKLQDTVAASPDFGGVHAKVSTASWNVHTLPQQENSTRYLTPPTTISTAGFVSAMCYLYRVFSAIPAYQHLAASCSTAAFRGWHYLTTHHQTALDAVNNPSGGFISTATYDWYPDADERIWAAAELYRTFQHSAAHAYFLANYTYCNQLLLDNSYYAHDVTGSSCPAMQFHQQFAWLGFISYLDALNPDPSALTVLNNWLISHADTIVSRTNNDFFSFSLRTWGNNYNLLNNAPVLKKAFDKTGNIVYKQALHKNLDYILGKNITSYSFVTGYGSQSPTNLNHLHTRNDGSTDIPAGAMVGGPAANPITPPPLPMAYQAYNGIALYFDTCTMHAKRYLDLPYAPFPNEPTIDYNARLVYALYALLPFSITGISDPPVTPLSLRIYPNPNRGIFTLHAGQPLTRCHVEMYNGLGQRIYRKAGVSLTASVPIEISGLSSGVYIVYVRCGNQIFRQKIIIQH
jgi:hypothetical protein